MSIIHKRLAISVLLICLFSVLIYIGVGYFIYTTLARAEPGCGNNCSNSPNSFMDHSSNSDFAFSNFSIDYWESYRYPGGDEGIELDAWWIPVDQNGAGDSPVIILTHGLRASKYDSDILLVAAILNEAGFNTLLFDQRDHGMSTIEDGQISVGTKEYRDLISSVDWLVDEQSINPNRIGVYGLSMGAGTAAIAFGLDERIRAVVLESGYSDLNVIVKEELEREGYPSWLSKGAVWAAYIFGNETLLEPSPQLAFMNHSGRPIFAMHGTGDTRVLPHHTSDMAVFAEKYGANLETWMAENAIHSGIKFMYFDEFASRLIDFFKSNLEGDLKPKKT